MGLGLGEERAKEGHPVLMMRAMFYYERLG